MILKLKDLFPDYKEIAPGNWSENCVRTFAVDEGKYIEIGLYREPLDEEYAGTLTLQIFLGDDVVLCEQVEEEE